MDAELLGMGMGMAGREHRSVVLDSQRAIQLAAP